MKDWEKPQLMVISIKETEYNSPLKLPGEPKKPGQPGQPDIGCICPCS